MSGFSSSSSSRFFSPKENVHPRQNAVFDLTSSPTSPTEKKMEPMTVVPLSAEKQRIESNSIGKTARKSSPYFGKKKKGGVAVKTPPVLKEPDTCAICLDTASNPAKLKTCIHVFCFECINHWATIKLECPYCKKPFKEALCREGHGGGFKRIEFDEPQAADDSEDEGEEFGYFMDEGYNEEEDSDYEPQEVVAEAHHGYESDDGFIVSDDENESSYEEESFQDDLEAAEAALEDRNRSRRRRRRNSRSRNVAGDATSPVDLVSPDTQGGMQESPMDLVTPEEEQKPGANGNNDSEEGPSDLLSRFGFTY